MNDNKALSKQDDGLIHEMRTDIKLLLQSDATLTQILKSIEEQTKKTNGRVTALETAHACLEKKHDKIVNQAIGWAAGVSLCITAVYRVFFK